jgi:hypothetical protein
MALVGTALLMAACGPARPAQLDTFEVDFGAGTGLLEGTVEITSISEDVTWVYGVSTQAPSVFDPGQEDIQSGDRRPLEWPLEGISIEAGDSGTLPLTYDCSITEERGLWAAGLRVLAGPVPGGFEMASWDLGTADLRGECE